MTSLNTAVVTIFAVLHLCTSSPSDAQIDHVVFACRQQCFNDVTSVLSDIGFGDCFDACMESSSLMTSSLFAAGQGAGSEEPTSEKPEENDAVGSEMKRKSRHHLGHQLASRVSPRGIGSGSASKYLRIGRKFDVERDLGAEVTDELMDESEKRKAWSGMDKSSMSLTSKLGSKNAKNYLRVGKKSVKNVV